jgi:hypothetical protein
MLTGKRFRLTTAILGIETIDAKRVAVEIPQGATVEVTAGPSQTDSRMVDVLWNARTVVMFAQDITERAEQLTRRAANR